MSHRIHSLSRAVTVCLGVLGVALGATSLAASGHRTGLGAAHVAAAAVGHGPSEVAVDPDTHTAYVTNGNNANGPDAGGDTVSVIDTRHCDARDVSRCRGPWPTIRVGKLPAGIAVDQQTDTVYVASVAGDSVSVFNGATCNADNPSGCGQTAANVPVGLHPFGLFDDPVNHTVYVADFGGPAVGGNPGDSSSVSMIDTATCDAADLTGCPRSPVPTVTVGGAPGTVTVDQANDSVYVTTIGKGLQNGYSVFSAATCNATVQTGCSAIGRLPGDPAGPSDAEVDEANATLYTANYDNTISAYDLSRCDAADLTGCADDKPGTVTPWPDPGFQENDLFAAVDPARHSVYVSYQKDAVLVVVNTNVCNGTHPAGCAHLKPRSVYAGPDPQGVTLDPATQTLYAADEVDDRVSVIDASACNAQVAIGCRRPAPSVSIPQAGPIAPDQAVHTAYVTSGSRGLVMLDTRRCNAHAIAGCARPAPHVTVGGQPGDIAINPRTGTVYVTDQGRHAAGEVMVVDARRCNATRTAGCSHLKTLALSPGVANELAINPVTDTVYATVATAHGHDVVDVFNGATCNATRTAGCDQAPGEIKLGESGGGLGKSGLNVAVNPRTDTLYATNVLSAENGHTVDVLNGATCDAVHRAGCGQKPTTITVGDDPRTPVVDPGTDTVYVADHADGDYAATVSVIDGASCNGTRHRGCRHRPAVIPVGFGAIGLAVDAATHRVYSANLHDASVSAIDGAACNARRDGGCRRSPPREAVGNYPFAVAVDRGVGTVYVVNADDTLSVVPLRH